MNAILITTSNTISVEHLTDAPLYKAAAKAIGCDWIEIVRPVGLSKPYCMIVDEEGLLKDKPVINHVGSILYGAHIHGSAICGDIVIMKEALTPEGPDIVGLDDDELTKLYNKLKVEFNLKEKE